MQHEEAIQEVTRLQAEVSSANSRLHDVATLCATVEQERNALQSELTKARELFQVIVNWPDGGNRYGQENIKAFVRSNQSAPADKGQGKREGKRERFQKWVLATKHPVLGFLDGHWLARGDDREGYASEYVQGLWVAYKAFAVEQPAPAAVVMPELRTMGVNQEYKRGCRDTLETVRRNLLRQGFEVQS